MVPDSALLVMLGAIETADENERRQKIQDLGARWNTDAETMRAIDWYAMSRSWNVCHTLWQQAKCAAPAPSENAVGVARELLNDMLVSDPPAQSTK